MAAIDNAAISAEVAGHVLFHFNRSGGLPVQGHTATLMSAITRTDPTSRTRWARDYPAYVKAISLAESGDEGVAELQAIVCRGDV